MKTFLGVFLFLCVFGLSAGCHSGTTRGVGSDISKIGDSMQR